MIAALLLACVPQEPAPPVAAFEGPRLVHVGEPARFSTSGADLTFEWDLGDGTRASGPEIEAAWAAPGHYTLRLQATDEAGAVATSTARITAVYAPLAAPPAHSASLALDGARVWVALPEHDLVAEVDVETGQVVHHAVCAGPRWVSVAAGRVWASCPEDDALSVYDGAWKRIGLAWGDRPAGVLARPEGGAWVVLAGRGALGSVGPDGALTQRPAVPDARGLALSEGTLFTAAWRPAGGETALARFGAAEGEATRSALGSEPGPDSDTHARGLATWLAGPVISPDGRTVHYPGLNANIERGLFVEGTRLEHDTTTRATVRRRPVADDAPLPSLSFDDRDLVSALVFTPAGDRLVVGFVGAGVVELRDALDHQPLHRWSMPDANPVTGLVVSADGAVLWAYDGFGERLLAFRLDELSPDPEASFPLTLGLPEPLSAAERLGRAVFHRSADRRMTPNGYVSCAVCHLEGEQDGLVWDFTQRGEGLRNTLSLRGLGDGPFHWSANFDELQDFENDIRLHQGGAGFLSEADWAVTEAPLGPEKAGLSPELDALAAWMRALPGPPRSPWRAADGGRTEAGIRGETLFVAHGCPACHPAPAYTDAGWVEGEPVLHDVGTQHAGSGQRLGAPLTGLRTPSLRGAHATGPWLHDGSAATIEAAIGAHVPGVPAGELAEIAAFVREVE